MILESGSQISQLIRSKRVRPGRAPSAPSWHQSAGREVLKEAWFTAPAACLLPGRRSTTSAAGWVWFFGLVVVVLTVMQKQRAHGGTVHITAWSQHWRKVSQLASFKGFVSIRGLCEQARPWPSVWSHQTQSSPATNRLCYWLGKRWETISIKIFRQTPGESCWKINVCDLRFRLLAKLLKHFDSHQQHLLWLKMHAENMIGWKLTRGSFVAMEVIWWSKCRSQVLQFIRSNGSHLRSPSPGGNWLRRGGWNQSAILEPFLK